MNLTHTAGFLILPVLAACTSMTVSPPEQVRNFKSCPIVRDTDTVPCWLAEHEGELYYLGIQTDVSSPFHPPLLGHQVIVEGEVSEQPRICGGIVLEPVAISVVEEMDANCNTMLPAEDQYSIDFNPRPPGPSTGRLSFQDSNSEDPVPEPDSDDGNFTIHYYFDDLIDGRNAADLNAIFSYAREIEATRMTVTGYQGNLLLSDGSTLEESAGLAERRAHEVARLLQDAGLEVEDVSLHWEPAIPADGIRDWLNRRVEVTLRP